MSEKRKESSENILRKAIMWPEENRQKKTKAIWNIKWRRLRRRQNPANIENSGRWSMKMKKAAAANWLAAAQARQRKCRRRITGYRETCENGYSWPSAYYSSSASALARNGHANIQWLKKLKIQTRGWNSVCLTDHYKCGYVVSWPVINVMLRNRERRRRREICLAGQYGVKLKSGVTAGSWQSI